jgi:hypothetical protein
MIVVFIFLIFCSTSSQLFFLFAPFQMLKNISFHSFLATRVLKSFAHPSFLVGSLSNKLGMKGGAIFLRVREPDRSACVCAWADAA